MLKFGTDGWRAIISDEFTFENVRKVGRAITLYLINHGFAQKPLIIGYDPRFLADKFAQEIAKIAMSAGINVLMDNRDTPTPVIAWEVRDRKAAGAVMLTASHNPAEYCGIKFIPDYAGPANETITAELQENSNKEIELPKPAQHGTLEHFEPRERYFKYLETLIDLPAIKAAKLKIVCDPMYGAGRGYLDRFLKAEVIHGTRDVLFGGDNPEPEEGRLTELRGMMREGKGRYDLGLANDGDADRFGVVDEQGQFYSANMIIPLLLDYLVKERGIKGSVVRSVATTHLIDRVAAKYKINVHETPVGFKHIAKIMLEEPVIIGGEESGGLSIKGHIPEKDGILADLLVVEMVTKRKKPLSTLWQDMVHEFGQVINLRTNLELAERKGSGNCGLKSAVSTFMKLLREKTPTELAGIKVQSVNKIDGVKLLLADGSWVLARPSGTEPLVRIYVESDDQNKIDAILGEMNRKLQT